MSSGSQEGRGRERGSPPRSRLGPFLTWLPLAALVLGVALAVILWRAYSEQERRMLMLVLDEEAQHVQAEMRAGRLQMEAAFSRLAQRVAAAAEPDEDMWALEAGLLLSAWPSLDVLMWIRPVERERWVMTRPGEGVLVDPGLNQEIRAAMQAAVETNVAHYTPPMEIGALEGEAVVLPFLLEDEEPFFLVAIKRIPDLFEDLLGPGILERYAVRVRGGEDRNYWLGVEPVVDLCSGLVPLVANGVTWWVSVSPVGLHWQQLRVPNPQALLGFGMIASLLVAVSIFSLGLARRRAEAAELSGRRLASEVEERRSVEETLRGKRDVLEGLTRRLEASNRDLERFGSVVAHDLKEPMVTVGMYVEELDHDLREGKVEDAAEHAARIGVIAERMKGLVDAVLAHSRIGTAELSFRPMSLSEVVSSVVDDLRDLIARAEGRVEVADLPVIEAEASQMSQLFTNIISNGIKFRREEEPPVVGVSAEREERPGDRRGPWWRIRITDNGIGFREEEAGRLFGEFSRLGGAQRFEGTGMGLAISRRIVERHGGEISAKPNEGHGATIEVLLPSRQLLKSAGEETPKGTPHEEEEG